MNNVFFILATLLFAIALVIVIASIDASKEVTEGLLLGGLTAFAAGHVNWHDPAGRRTT